MPRTRSLFVVQAVEEAFAWRVVPASAMACLPLRQLLGDPKFGGTRRASRPTCSSPSSTGPDSSRQGVKDRSQIANPQPLQKVEFQVAYEGSDYLITEIK
jgi:hypothetical protein